MAIQTQLRRGTTSQNNSFTGASAEVTVDTDTDALRVHDGSTAGGHEVTMNTKSQTLTNKTITASGRVQVDDTTEATSTTDGSLQTDGGLSVAKDIVGGDDLLLKSDSSQIAFGADGDITLAHNHNAGLTTNGDLTVGDDLSLTSDGAVISLGADSEVTLTHVHNSGIRLEDNDKLLLGTGADLEIYHDASNSYIDDSGTGGLYLRSNQLEIHKYTGETMATFTADGAVALRHDNTTRLTTTADGITVNAGNITFDTASKGIHLGVTTATSANLLDDYEEGTWTPNLYGATDGLNSTGSQNGTGIYRKIGSLVWVSYFLNNVTTSGQDGQFLIGNLPFSAGAAIGVGAPMMFGLNHAACDTVVNYVSGTTIQFYTVTDDAGWGQVSATNENLYLTHSFAYHTS